MTFKATRFIGTVTHDLKTGTKTDGKDVRLELFHPLGFVGEIDIPLDIFRANVGEVEIGDEFELIRKP